MRFQAFLILITAIFVVTGCGGHARYDGRLVQADSLMWSTPDSALAVLSALDTLRGAADSAYRDLLLTQARYKAYQPITARDDSAITRALHWYRAHNGEREKLTRANLYKGAVMEELGRIDSAMYYYKTAEAAADTTDYTNLGQINIRIADLYRRYHGDMQACYEKSKQALRFYRLINDKQQQLACLIMVASSNGVVHKENSERLLHEASRLATELNDSASYFMCQELMCRQLLQGGKSYIKAKRIALDCYQHYGKYVNQHLLLDLADIYARTGVADSARYYIDKLNQLAHSTRSGQSTARYNFILSRISRLEGDSIQSALYDMQGHEVSDSIQNNKVKHIIHQVESDFNAEQDEQNQLKLKLLHWTIIALIVVGLAIIVSIIYTALRKQYVAHAIIRDLKKAQIQDHDDLLNQLDTKSAVIERLVSNLVPLLKYCSGNEALNSTPEIAKQIKETVVEVADEDFWRELRTFLDKKHNGIISSFASYPRITNKDLKFIELSCCGFSYIEMAMILNYSPRYVINKRKIIAKKLNLDIPLQDYLEQLLEGNR